MGSCGDKAKGPVPPPETTCPPPQLASPQKEHNKVSALPAAPESHGHSLTRSVCAAHVRAVSGVGSLVENREVPAAQGFGAGERRRQCVCRRG